MVQPVVISDLLIIMQRSEQNKQRISASCVEGMTTDPRCLHRCSPAENVLPCYCGNACDHPLELFQHL